MFRVSHRISRPLPAHIPNTSARTGRLAAEMATKTPYKCPEDLKLKTSSQNKYATEFTEVTEEDLPLFPDFLSVLCVLCGYFLHDLPKFRERFFQSDIQQTASRVQNPIVFGLNGG